MKRQVLCNRFCQIWLSIWLAVYGVFMLVPEGKSQPASTDNTMLIHKKSRDRMSIRMERWTERGYIKKVIRRPEGIKDIQMWLEKNSGDLKSVSEIGAVIPECKLIFSERDEAKPNQVIEIYGEIDSQGNRAISESELQVLFEIFEKWGEAE